MSPDPEAVLDTASELGIEPAFVEKDWYAVQVLQRIAQLKDDNVAIIFCGGTSLSKAHQLLQRFSEDLDFRGQFVHQEPSRRNRSTRSAFRQKVTEALAKYSLSPIETKAGGNYFKFPITYQRQLDDHTALRPELQVEFSFTQPRIATVKKPIFSFIAQCSGTKPEAEIDCLSPVETGADKLSALTWRVLKRNRGAEHDDPTIIRHLHDLYALKELIEQNVTLFKNTVASSFEEDQRLKKRITNLTMVSSMKSALTKLQDDYEYQEEYERFVDAMSYSDDRARISFDDALDYLQTLISRL